MLEKILELDHAWFFAINGLNNPLLDYFFGTITYLGSEIVVPIIVFGLIYKKIPKPNRKTVVIHALAGLMLCGIFSQGTKALYPRLRPSKFFYVKFMEESGIERDRSVGAVAFMKRHGIDIHIVGTRLKNRSFPSGHTVTAFGGAAILWVLFGGWYWVALPLAFLAGYSRIYVGAHFPSDVIVGAIVGFYVNYFFMMWCKRKLKK